MNLRYFHSAVQSLDGRPLADPIIIRLSDHGCGLKGCHCSPDFFVTVCVHGEGLCVTMTEREFRAFQRMVASGCGDLRLP